MSALNVEIAARVVIYLLYTCGWLAGWLLTSIFFIRRLLLCSLYYSRFARLNSVLTYSPKTHGGKKETRKKKLSLNTMKIGDRFHPFIRQILLIFFFWFYVRRSTMRVTMSWHFFFNGERRRRFTKYDPHHIGCRTPKVTEERSCQWGHTSQLGKKTIRCGNGISVFFLL